MENLKRKRFTLFTNIIEFWAALSFIDVLEFPLVVFFVFGT